MKMNYLIIPILILMIGIVLACKKNDNTNTNISFEAPTYFPSNTTFPFNENPINQETFDLGKALFYDGLLSRDGSISCGSCHLQAQAFVQVDHDFSHGIDDQLTERNTPALQNLAWSPYFFWVGGVPSLYRTSMAPLENPLEMDEKIGNVLTKLRKHTSYPAKFQKAFGDTTITQDRFLKALAQFMVMLVSADSKYDQVVHKKTNTFTTDEQKGYELFQQKCISCHPEPLFTDHIFRNNGIQSEPFGDIGRASASGVEPQDLGLFKTPSLRNIAITYPYMHNGKLSTLEKVIDHYDSGVISSTTLDNELKKEIPYGIRISSDEKTQLVAFLKTLTDETFIRDKRFSE